MKAVIRQSLALFLFWTILFASFRPVFLWWQPGLDEFGFFTLGESMVHGLYMDVSLAGYFSILPILWFAFQAWMPERIFWKTLHYYQAACIMAVSFLFTADLEIFHTWGHHIDSAVIPYLRFPREAFASTLSAPWHLLIPVIILFSLLWLKGWNLCSGFLSKAEAPSKWQTIPAIIMAAACILPIRGGFQLAPMNQSSVYFSGKRILNQAAENPVWVLFQSLLEGNQDELKKLYVRQPEEAARQFCDSLYEDKGITEKVLGTNRPNVVLIIWESLSAKVAGCTGGIVPSTPNLDRLAQSGLLFDRIYANGDRSDKGLVSILSGQPAFGKISLMQHPNLSAGFDFLNRRFEKMGYSSQYFYGGELEFANMKSYLLNAGFQKLSGKESFPPESWNSKWGAHDEVVLDRQLQEAGKEKQPFFHTLFTLSSHEPFEIPGHSHEPGTPGDSLFCRAHRYTDRCLGQWVAKASKASWWKNTLVIVIADHGHSQPANSEESDPEKFRIPMLWFGPALKKTGVQHRQGNQADLFASLCRQLGDSASLPPFSKNLFSDGSKDFAFYAFRNGCALMDGQNQKLSFDQGAQSRPAELFRQRAFLKLFK